MNCLHPRSWTFICNEWPSQKGLGRDIETVQIINRFSIILYLFWKLKQGQNEGFRRTYRFCTNFHRKLIICLFTFIRRLFQDILVIENQGFNWHSMEAFHIQKFVLFQCFLSVGFAFFSGSGRVWACLGAHFHAQESIFHKKNKF